jgi:hypothetical protein
LAEQNQHSASRSKLPILNLAELILLKANACYQLFFGCIFLAVNIFLICPKGMTVNIWPGRPDISLRASAVRLSKL